MCSAGGSYAFMKAYMHASKTNTFAISNPSVEIIEPNVSNPNSVEWGDDSKNVKLKNTSADGTTGYVRALIYPEITDSSGAVAGINTGVISKPVNALMHMGDITLVFLNAWANDWVYKDNYFYYKHPLEANQETSLLLRGVQWTDIHDNIDVNVLADIVPITSDVESIWGVTLDSSGNITG